MSGVILFGMTLVAAAIYSPYQATVGYSSELGLYVSTLGEIGVFPLMISTALFASGIYFVGKNMKN